MISAKFIFNFRTALMFILVSGFFSSSQAEITGALRNVIPAVMTSEARSGVSAPYCRYGQVNGVCVSTADNRGEEAEVIRVASNSGPITCGSAAICGTFNKRLPKCGCKIGPPRITRQKRGGKSCHNSGRAIDVMSIYCGGRKYKGTTDRYKKWVRCMAPSGGKRGVWSGGGMTVLFQQAHKRKQGITKAHYDHAHFSIKCNGYI